jgi:purine-cytosine permease-like protein
MGSFLQIFSVLYAAAIWAAVYLSLQSAAFPNTTAIWAAGVGASLPAILLFAVGYLVNYTRECRDHLAELVQISRESRNF